MRRVKALIFLTATMRLMPAVTIEQYHPHDFTLSGQASGSPENASGNPFNVEVRGEFTGPDGTRITVPGVYTGGNIWKVSFTPPKPSHCAVVAASPSASPK